MAAGWLGRLADCHKAGGMAAWRHTAGNQLEDLQKIFRTYVYHIFYIDIFRNRCTYNPNCTTQANKKEVVVGCI